jgi:ATP-dependent helicase HrpA
LLSLFWHGKLLRNYGVTAKVKGNNRQLQPVQKRPPSISGLGLFPGHHLLMELSYPSNLPITGQRETLVEAIRHHQVVIVAGDTGSGKTTQLPKMCLEAGRGRNAMIGCTQPRRIAALTISSRIAEELGRQSSLVGYKIRFQDSCGRNTRIKLMTDGILLAEARSDPLLRQYDTIIIDEAHERSLNIDFLLGIMPALLEKRPELKLLITSATIDTEKFAAAFGGAPVIAIAGRTYPIEVRYRPDQGEQGDEDNYIDRTIRQVLSLHASESGGDILVFMPTERDIRDTIDGLRTRLAEHEEHQRRAAVLLPLYGRLTGRDQARVFQPVNGRKIVVATNVAETSLTVPGIRYVVDTGLARVKFYNPRAGTTKMPVAKISQASCEQRKGRCGRIGSGICVRLYGEEDFFNRSHFTVPEILRANLADVILRMLAFKLGDPARFPFIDSPSARSIRDGYAMLHELGAIHRDRGGKGRWRLTRQGALMARLPLDPRISRIIIEARQKNCLREAVIIAAALSIQDPRVRPADQEKEADAAHALFAAEGSDFSSFVTLWKAFDTLYGKKVGQAALRRFCRQHFLAYQRVMEWRDIHEQIVSILKQEKGFFPNMEPASEADLHQAILSGHLRSVAVKKEKNIYLGAKNRECMIFPGSNLFNKAGQWIMAAEMVETSRLYARIVGNIKVEWIEPLAADLCRSSYSEPHWEKKRGQVVAFEKVTLFGLVIVARRKVDFGRVRPEEARRIFIQEALVEQNLGGRFPFFEQNRGLRKKLEEIEDRLRSRAVTVSDTGIYTFYEQRLPGEIRDRATLAKFLKDKSQQKKLQMREEDLISEHSGRLQRLEQFPGSLECGEIELPLSYVFDPGGEEDGVSVSITAELLDSVSESFFEWLVPGLLEEKILFLLKGLPKSKRRNLVPIPETAAYLTAHLPIYSGSIYGEMEREILRKFGVRIARREWPVEDLPAHLRMRFRLLQEGRQIHASRNFNELLPHAGRMAGGKILEKEKKKWQQQNVGVEILNELPGKMPLLTEQGQLQGYCFPALKSRETGQVDLVLTRDRQEAAEMNRNGMLVFFQRDFSRQWRQLKKDIALSSNKWMLLEGLVSHKVFNLQLFSFVLQTVFGVRDGDLPSADGYAAIVARVREKGLYPLGRALQEKVEKILQLRSEILVAMRETAGKYPDPHIGERLASVEGELKQLVPEDFLELADPAYLADTPRYLQALAIRLRRLSHSPLKDKEKEAELLPFIENLRLAQRQKDESPERIRLLQEYAAMLQELKISVYAQEIKTAFPVSFKRLEKKWEELEGFIPHPGL